MAALFYILLVLPGLFALSNAASVATKDVVDNTAKNNSSEALPEALIAANGTTPIELRETPESFIRRFMIVPPGVNASIDPDLYYQNHTQIPPVFQTQTGPSRINWAGCDCQRIGSFWMGSSSCRIVSPAAKGKYCYCTYVQFGTCHGYAYDCPADKMHWAECQGTCTTDQCCRNVPISSWKSPSCDGSTNLLAQAVTQHHQDGMIYGPGQTIPMGHGPFGNEVLGSG